MESATSGPSKQSLRGLDALYLILADVQGGLRPFLAVFLASVHHWNPAQIGVAMAVMGFAGIAFQTPAGAIIDAVRQTRVVIAAAFALVAVGALATAAMPTIAVVLAAQALIGAASAVFGPATTAISLGLVGHAGLARRMGRNQALDHTGNIIAAGLAGAVGDSVGYGAIFVLVAVMCLAGIAVNALIRGCDIDHARARGSDSRHAGCPTERGNRVPASAAEPEHVARLSSVFADRRIAILAISVVLFHFANAAMLPLVGQKLTTASTGGAAKSMSACIIAAQFVMIPVALLASRLAVSWGRKPTFLIGFAVLPVRGVLYTLSTNPYYLVAVQLLDGIGAGIFGVVGVLMIADLAHGTGRFNLLQGAVATATALGASLSNVLTGAIVNAAGFDAGFLTLATIATVALAFFGVAMPETQQSLVTRPSKTSPLRTPSCSPQ
jgi:MFS family permease